MGWLSGWQYRKSHEIEGSTAGAQTNYQIRIIIHKGSGTDGEEHVYCNNHCRDDFGDIRFTKSDGETLLDYWMEEYTSGDKATFWVEVDSIPASPDKATIYIYYGKSDAATTSNGKNTFLKFYDFNTDESDEWTLDAGSWEWDTTNGYLKLKTSSSEDRARISGYTASTGIAIRARLYGSTSPDDYIQPSIIFGYQDGSNFYMTRISYVASRQVQLYKKVGGSFTKIAYVDEPNIQKNAWHILDVAWISASHVKVWFDETLEIDQTSNLESWTSGDIGVRDYYSESWYDYFFVRKYVEPEPTHGSWGNEEQSGATEVAITDSTTGIEALSRPYRGLTFTDIATSQESFSRPYRQLQIPEQASSLELLLKTRNLNLGDIAASLEIIERARQIGAITDTAQSLEQILKQRFTSLLDAAAGGEIIARPTRMTILADEALSQEILSKLRELTAVTDSAIGIEYVNVGAEGAIKTRIFLLMGDLAVQITGE